MSEAQPKFMKSEYFYYDSEGRGALKYGAPAELVQAFEKWYSRDNTEGWSAKPEPTAEKPLTLDDLCNE